MEKTTNMHIDMFNEPWPNQDLHQSTWWAGAFMFLSLFATALTIGFIFLTLLFA